MTPPVPSSAIDVSACITLSAVRRYDASSGVHVGRRSCRAAYGGSDARPGGSRLRVRAVRDRTGLGRALPDRVPRRGQPVPGADAASAGSSRRRVPARGHLVPTDSEHLPSRLLRPPAARRRPGSAWSSPPTLLLGVAQQAPLPVTMLAWFVLWALYSSIVNIGGTFYSFGWETLLLEAGFLAIFLGNAATPPLFPVILAVPLARLPRRVRRRADQAARRSVLARPDLHGLPPRDPADAEPVVAGSSTTCRGRSTGSRSSGTSWPSCRCRSGLFLPQPVASIAARS